jgi:hypothetical protein
MMKRGIDSWQNQLWRKKRLSQWMWKKVPNTSGVRAAKVTISHFATARTRAPNSHPWRTKLNNHVPFTFADANAPVVHRSVMVLTTRWNSWLAYSVDGSSAVID